MVFPDNGQHVHTRRSAGPKHLDDLTFGINMAGFPRLESHYDFVAASRLSRAANVNVMDDPWIIRDDVEKILRLFQRPDDRIVGALEDPNHASFRAIAALGAGMTFVPRDPRHHLVAMHRRAR